MEEDVVIERGFSRLLAGTQVQDIDHPLKGVFPTSRNVLHLLVLRTNLSSRVLALDDVSLQSMQTSHSLKLDMPPGRALLPPRHPSTCLCWGSQCAEKPLRSFLAII